VSEGSGAPAPQRLLLVEDEAHLAAGLRLNLELEGYQADVASTARQAGEFLLTRGGYDAIVLDVMLPDLDGFALCEKLREAGDHTPVIMLTARAAAEDRVRGLEAGADDYLVKPFELNELLARVRSMLRRRRWERGEEPARRPKVLTVGAAVIDLDTYEAKAHGSPVHLTRLELDLLRFFVENPNRVVSRDELLEKVWKLRNYSTHRTVDNFISRLRRHVEADPANPTLLVSVRGTGYRYVP
jgi:DNA-binding response OmpR family regulator